MTVPSRAGPRVAVVVPPITDFYATPRRHSALGARRVVDLLRRHGVDSRLFDATVPGTGSRTVAIPPTLSHVVPYLDPDEFGPVAFHRLYRQYGQDPASVAAQVSDFAPELILLSSFAFAYAEDAMATAKALRKELPGIPIVAGGAGPTVHPAYYSAEPSITVVPGAIEDSGAPLASIVRDRPTTIANAQTAVLANSLAGLTPLAAPDSDIQPVLTVSHGVLTTILSAGCRHRCRFCSIHLTQGSVRRRVDPESLDRQLREIPPGTVRAVNFEDDALLEDVDYLEVILSILRRRLPGVELRAENGLDPDGLSDRTIGLLAQSGMRQLNISIASAAPTIRTRERRTQDLRELDVDLERAHGLGMHTTLFWICGLEADTPGTVIETLSFIFRLGSTSGISLFYPVPGLPGFPESTFRASSGLSHRAKGSAAFPWTGSLTTRQLVTAFRLSRLLNAAMSRSDPELVGRCLRDRRLYTRHRRQGIIPLDPPLVDCELVEAFLPVLTEHPGTPLMRN